MIAYCSRALLGHALLFSIASAKTVAQNAAPVPVLREEDAVATVLNMNRDHQKSLLDTRRADAAIREARTNYFPQTDLRLIGGYSPKPLEFTLPAGALGTYPSTGPIPAVPETVSSGSNSFNLFVYATVAQPLSELYKIHLGVESARLQKGLAQEATRHTDQQLVAQVRQAYHRICQLDAKVQSDAAQEKSLEETERTASNAVAQGTALAGDLLQAKAALAQQRAASARDSDDLLTQREQLNHLLGRDLDTEFSVEPVASPSSEEIDLKASRALALQQRPEVRQADLQVKSAELDIRRKRAEYIPDVNAQVTYLGFQNVQFLSPNAVNLGVSLRWQNPWDWGKRSAEISGLREVAAQQKLSSADARQQVVLDVDQRFRALREARLSVEAAQLARDASQEKLRVLTNQYQHEAALLQDVLRQNADLQQQNATYAEALANFWSTRADFERSLGADQ